MEKRIFLHFAAFSVLFLTFFVFPSYARISIGPDFQGTLVITASDGNVSLVEKGEPLPEIQPGSTIEVIQGEFKVTVEGQDTVQLSCLNHKMTLTNEANTLLRCEEESGLVKALKGTAELTDPAGKKSLIDEGKEYSIQGRAAKKAAPAGEGEPLGGAPAGGDLASEPPVDSRSLETSPS